MAAFDDEPSVVKFRVNDSFESPCAESRVAATNAPSRPATRSREQGRRESLAADAVVLTEVRLRANNDLLNGAPGVDDWKDRLRDDGYAYVASSEMFSALKIAPTAWDAFAASWNDLGVDVYMADGGRYRRRRHGAFRVTGKAATRKPHQAHYQSRNYNALNGGIARWFEPITEAVAEGEAFRAVLGFCTQLFDGMTPAANWHVEAHQFRIEAKSGQVGKPTPEGMHQDGVDWVLVLMIDRINIASGATTIHGLDRRLLGSFTLERPGDAALADDRRVFHGVTPVLPLDPTRSAYRDVLVMTYRRDD